MFARKGGGRASVVADAGAAAGRIYFGVACLFVAGARGAFRARSSAAELRASCARLRPLRRAASPLRIETAMAAEPVPELRRAAGRGVEPVPASVKYLLLGSVEYGVLHPTVAMGKAKEAAMTALRIDPALAEAHASLAYVRVFDWDWAEAESEYRRAIELNPSYATAHHWYALFLTAMKRPEEALTEIKRAHELDPLSLPINVGVGFYYHLTRQYKRAIEEYRRAIEMDPDFGMAHFGLAMSCVQNFMYDEAVEEYRAAMGISGASPLMRAGIGHAYAMSGRRDRARKILKELSENFGDGAAPGAAEQQYVSAYGLAALCAALGDKSAAFEWLRRACDTRSEGLFWLQVDPALDSLRADPRFANILRCVRLL